jgi:hypothetical protein
MTHESLNYRPAPARAVPSARGLVAREFKALLAAAARGRDADRRTPAPRGVLSTVLVRGRRQ